MPTLYFSEQYKPLVDDLCNRSVQPELNEIFPRYRDLMLFAAMIGKRYNRRSDRKGNGGEVESNYFKSTGFNKEGVVYLLGLLERDDPRRPQGRRIGLLEAVRTILQRWHGNHLRVAQGCGVNRTVCANPPGKDPRPGTPIEKGPGHCEASTPATCHLTRFDPFQTKAPDCRDCSFPDSSDVHNHRRPRPDPFQESLHLEEQG